ncbi:MAG: hypothetical protein GWN00_35625, partial [Aliifodinibius sp.]|nr:hypothetical protein [candidate division Zixibacteria bacterium]NIR67419.1 hypothetical protein [candidate division Zixibacteria bacterium]NIT61349.1 hypothetical protein [Fodinibius sp.]NIY29929.1 hypothetical protein [Fodinibius sp.]
MADFTISAKIVMEATEAIRASEELQSNMGEMASETGTTSRKTQLDVNKMTASFALLGATAGGALAAITAASPSMTVAMMEMRFALQEVAIAIGEDLAPVINDYLVPVIESFRDFIMGLNPEVRQWIGLTIVLTAAISALALAVAALSAVSLPLIAVIVAIAAVVAAIIIVWRKWNDIIAWAQENTGKFILIIAALSVIFGPVVIAVLAVIAVIKNL